MLHNMIKYQLYYNYKGWVIVCCFVAIVSKIFDVIVIDDVKTIDSYEFFLVFRYVIY